MRAMILKTCSRAEENPLYLSDITCPKPGKGQVLIKVSACGVCHTDLHIVEGELPLKTSPIIPGHEIIGGIVELGEGVKKFKRGDRVGIPWLYSSCGKCEFCKNAKENLCEDPKFTGWHVNGGYAEFVIGLEDFIYRIPDAFDDFHAAPLMCAGVVGYRAYRLSNIKRRERLGLFGFGATAHVIIQIARHHGIETFVFTRSADHKRHAEMLGASWAGDPGDRPPLKMDSSIIFAPSGKVVLQALEATRKGGTVANSSIYVDQIPPMDYEKHLYYEKKLISVANSTRKDVIDCLKECAKAKIKTDIEVFPLAEANEVLQRLKRSEIKGAAVLKIGD